MPFFVCFSQVLFATHSPSHLHCLPFLSFVHFFSFVNLAQSLAAATTSGNMRLLAAFATTPSARSRNASRFIFV